MCVDFALGKATAPSAADQPSPHAAACASGALGAGGRSPANASAIANTDVNVNVNANVLAGADAPAKGGRVARLLGMGISETVALELLAAHVPERIDCALDNAAYLASNNRLTNAPGYVIDALRKNYGPLPERLAAQRRDAKRRRQRQAGAQQIADERRRADDERRASLQADQEALAFVGGLDEPTRARAVRETLAGLPSSMRAALQDRDPLTSRNLAKLVRDHIRSRSDSAIAADAITGDTRTESSAMSQRQNAPTPRQPAACRHAQRA